MDFLPGHPEYKEPTKTEVPKTKKNYYKETITLKLRRPNYRCPLEHLDRRSLQIQLKVPEPAFQRSQKKTLKV